VLDGVGPTRRPRGTVAALRRHRLFGLALLAGTIVRLVAVIGFHPALWFNDSYEYVSIALRPRPYVVRPDGYSFLLLVLRPLHSFTLVVVLQHLMGLAIGVMVYTLCRRYGLGARGATAAALPVLLDGNGLALEHLVLSDTLFAFLVAAAVFVMLLPGASGRRPGLVSAGGAGALLAAAILTRTVGLVIAVVVAGWLLARWPGRRAFGAFAVALVVPVFGYAAWFHSAQGSYALTGADGVFLYSRTATFASCARMHPPADLTYLCPAPGRPRRPPSDYLWHLNQPLRTDQRPVFGGAKNEEAKRFAELAIRRQPLDYALAVLRDFGRTFGVGMSNYPSAGLVDHYRFSAQPLAVSGRTLVVGGTAIGDTTAYEHGSPATRLTEPFAAAVARYQRYVFLPGPALGLLLVIGLGGGIVAARRRRPGAPAAILLSATAFTLLIAPPALAGFDYRYIPPALGFLGAGAAIAIAALRSPAAGRDQSQDREQDPDHDPAAPLPEQASPRSQAARIIAGGGRAPGGAR
jgi:hypothetical protein